jgi:hypothetical protein
MRSGVRNYATPAQPEFGQPYPPVSEKTARHFALGCPLNAGRDFQSRETSAGSATERLRDILALSSRPVKEAIGIGLPLPTIQVP